MNADKPGSQNSPACPICAARSSEKLGVAPNYSGSDLTDVPEIGAYRSTLYRCNACHIVFRDKLLTLEQLRVIYDAMPEQSWQYATPQYWAWTRSAIAGSAPNKKVLDIGCFRGDFLASLGDEFELFGLEPNAKARKIAQERKVKIIGEYIEDLEIRESDRVGAVVMMDVIEHVMNPAETIRRVWDLLEPGGLLVLMTGDADSRPARRMLPYYWYMAFPYHLFFLGRGFIEWIAEKQSWKVEEFRPMPHKSDSRKIRLKQKMMFAGESLYKHRIEGRKSLSWARHLPVVSRAAARNVPYLFDRLTDHMWVVLRKKG